MSAYLDVVLPDSPKILLMFDEPSGSTFVDSSGNGHDASLTAGAPTYRATGPSGAIPFGLKLNNAETISVADHADLNIGDGPATFEYWYKCSNPDVTTRTICAKNANTNPGYQIFHHFPNRRFYFADGDGTGNILSSNIGYGTDASWHHCVVTRASAGDGNWYIDTVNNTTNSNLVTFTDSSVALLIGDDNPGHSHSDIYIAAFAIYKTQLSASVVAAHCAAGFGDRIPGITEVGRI